MQERTNLIWPAAGIVVAFVIAGVPAKPSISLSAGVAALCIDGMLVLILSSSQVGARLAALLAGMCLAVPCFVAASPLARLLLVCFLAIPLAASAAFLLMPAIPGLRGRLAHLCSWCGTRSVSRRTSDFDAAAVVRLAVATAILGATLAIVQIAGDAGAWLVPRWIVGGIAILAVAEMLSASHQCMTTLVGVASPSFFRSPHRSTSISEFWSRRWNAPASELFRRHCFLPLARHNAAVAMVATFAISAVSHGLLAFFALRSLPIAIACAAFFMLQPVWMAAERWLGVRRWTPQAGWLWTIMILAISSPLIVEPVLQIVERSSLASGNVLSLTVAALISVVFLTGIVSLACRLAVTGPFRALPPSSL